MSKELTENWREGTLPEGWYYLRLEPNFENRYDIVYNFGIDFDLYNTEDIEEVLAPVPSYDEYKKLEQQLAELQTEENNLLNDIVDLNLTIENRDKKLEIATKALNGIRDVWANNPSKFSYIARIANRKAKIALEEMEGVK